MTETAERKSIPTIGEMRKMTDRELSDLRLECTGAVASIESQLKTSNRHDPDREARARGALSRYTACIAQIRVMMAERNGEAVFRNARPVHDFESAIESQKALNRLIGLCRDLFDSVDGLLEAEKRSDDIPDDVWDRLDASHKVLADALGKPVTLEAVAA